MKETLILISVVTLLAFTDFFGEEGPKGQADTGNEVPSQPPKEEQSESSFPGGTIITPNPVEPPTKSRPVTPGPSPANVTRDAEYDLLKTLDGYKKQLGGIKPSTIKPYLEMVHIYVWRAAEFTSSARGAALMNAQLMLWVGAADLELQDGSLATALRLYAEAEAVAAIANEVVQDSSFRNLIADQNQIVGKTKRGLLAGRLRNIPREPLQAIYKYSFNKIYRIYRHEDEPLNDGDY